MSSGPPLLAGCGHACVEVCDNCFLQWWVNSYSTVYHTWSRDKRIHTVHQSIFDRTWGRKRLAVNYSFMGSHNSGTCLKIWINTINSGSRGRFGPVIENEMNCWDVLMCGDRHLLGLWVVKGERERERVQHQSTTQWVLSSLMLSFPSCAYILPITTWLTDPPIWGWWKGQGIIPPSTGNGPVSSRVDVALLFFAKTW